MSSSGATSTGNNANTGSTTARAASPKPPGGPATVMRRKAAADRAEKSANQRPSSTRAAGAGGSSSTMLRLYTDESPGLKVDPVVVMVLSVIFIGSVVGLHASIRPRSPRPSQSPIGMRSPAASDAIRSPCLFPKALLDRPSQSCLSIRLGYYL
ncbi:Sec61beta family-domain-containing protein [Massariosphaeria phaeospora]|uniref:Sec61beta family-domain-containing protein n=1 Tax=Massariosphaeria phaeospora TaxID=100035 RepID=A0A7C8IBE6_9PLEO|nr:Sec61beta family-domain-containing protein [Massariosphaeria phaeospora]